jgi:predicted amidophosphoribosyltransferase
MAKRQKAKAKKAPVERNVFVADQGHFGSTTCSNCGADAGNYKLKRCTKCKRPFSKKSNVEVNRGGTDFPS